MAVETPMPVIEPPATPGTINTFTAAFERFGEFIPAVTISLLIDGFCGFCAPDGMSGMSPLERADGATLRDSGPLDESAVFWKLLKTV